MLMSLPRKRLVQDYEETQFSSSSEQFGHKNARGPSRRRLRVGKDRPTRARARGSALGNFSRSFLILLVARCSGLPVSTSLHPNSRPLSLEHNSVFLHTLQHSSAGLSADRSIQTLGTLLTGSPANQDSAPFFSHQQNDVLESSLNEYKIACRQAQM